MIRYKIYQNQQQKGLNAGKWFARAVSDETFDLAKLAEHMSKHNSPYSGGVIKGVLSDMVDCIKELLLDGKCVKIDDLAIFGVGIRSKAADTLEDFSLEKNITGMRLKARATGNLSTTNLKLDIRRARPERVFIPAEGICCKLHKHSRSSITCSKPNRIEVFVLWIPTPQLRCSVL